MMTAFAILIGSLLTAIGRLTVPGHGLTGWPGTYEAFAHAWVGFLLGAIAYVPVARKLAAGSLFILTTMETIMFFIDQWSAI